MTNKQGYNKEATQAYIAKMDEVRKLLFEISKSISQHAEFGIDRVNWGHVGDLEHYKAELQDLRDSLLGEGEYAK